MFLERCVFQSFWRNTWPLTSKAVYYSNMPFAEKALTLQGHKKIHVEFVPWHVFIGKLERNNFSYWAQLSLFSQTVAPPPAGSTDALEKTPGRTGPKGAWLGLGQQVQPALTQSDIIYVSHGQS